MASSPDFVEYVCSQLSGAGMATSRKMFGEYGVYLDGKIIGLICDNQFFLKITAAGRAMQEEPVEAQAYPGSNPYFLIENLDDREGMTTLARATYNELPEKQPKKTKK